ncbi:MAG TPA: hypothetical protein RMH85_00630 [Polyangiaceae bacterium LLY-WYZ-15_(1-7)]|nr:hypothetical protein [Myxococcales bacterium]MAT27963.1 hypothetical protein [Sandaracinus sp.]HJL06109.1 hypothetical protein [Polyangiaceae bacterium LLY-WYZ-15_(1-7)]MBJ71237.1 hypothetical protein [Sandaracinus sp.]HJL06965.1 hypothetical protein [Polyangiaceae bacterium LLY-WYZ-15_(1-7)]
MRTPRFLFALALAPLLAGAPGAPASAQEMAQGEANITARADVRMALESGPATNGAKLSLIGGMVGGRLGAVRRCYRDRTEEDPAVQGRLRLVVELEPGGGTVEVTRDELNDRPLLRCVMRELRRAELGAVRPPGTAFVVLTFANTAAEGVDRMRERRAVEDAAPVERDAEGRPSATGSTEARHVRFQVVGAVDAPDAQVQAVHRVVRGLIPTLLDCRRRASRRYSPNGRIEVDLRVARSGRARARSRRSSVRDARGPRCVVRALQRQRFDGAAAGRTKVFIEFDDRQTEPSATPEEGAGGEEGAGAPGAASPEPSPAPGEEPAGASE